MDHGGASAKFSMRHQLFATNNNNNLIGSPETVLARTRTARSDSVGLQSGVNGGA
jgi:hypothetical protein